MSDKTALMTKVANISCARNHHNKEMEEFDVDIHMDFRTPVEVFESCIGCSLKEEFILEHNPYSFPVGSKKLIPITIRTRHFHAALKLDANKKGKRTVYNQAHTRIMYEVTYLKKFIKKYLKKRVNNTIK